jgi:uncharacterized protein (TIGR02757 family)
VSEGRALYGLLEDLYDRYTTPAHAQHDPVSFTYQYGRPADAEVAGLVAAFLAYGRLAQIMASVADALGRLGERPSRFAREAGPAERREAAAGFVHRFADGDQFARLLRVIGGVIGQYGSLQQCFRAHDRPQAQTILPGLRGLADDLRAVGGMDHLVADPRKGSACKRWHLYLRWMVRADAVDTGLWQGIGPERLIVPLDAHMWRVSRGLGLTGRGTCDLKAAREVTEAFRRIRPDDPVRYDFALMHASAEGDHDLQAWLRRRTAPR